MSNVIWYICITTLSVVIAAYTMYMKRDVYKISTYLVFYLFTSGATWILEFIVLGLFNAYAYKMGLFEDIWAQNLLGHLLLNASMFPAAAIVMVAYSLRYRAMALITAIFLIIEYIFAKQGIYEQHWWRYYMSATNVVVFLLISRKWFPKMNKERCGLTRALTFYFVALIFIHLPTPILLLMGKQHYQLDLINNIVNNFYRTSIMFSFTHHLILSGVIVFFVCKLKKWYWKIAPFIISIAVLTLYAKMNVLVMDDEWKLIYYLFIQLICIAAFILVEKYTLKPNEGCHKQNE